MTAFRDAWFKQAPKIALGLGEQEIYALEPVPGADGKILAWHALLTAKQYAFHDAAKAFTPWSKIEAALTKTIKDTAAADKVVPTHVFGAGIVADDGKVVLADHSVPSAALAPGAFPKEG